MTSHATRRRRELAGQLNVPNRTAANIIRARTTEQRASKEGRAGTASRPPVSLPTPAIRHFYLERETDYDVEVLIFRQTVAHFRMLGGPLTAAGIEQRKFGWVSSSAQQLEPSRTRASWVVDQGSWGAEWEPPEDELHDLAEKALADGVHRFKHVVVIHAPDKLALMASDRPLPTDVTEFTKMFPVTIWPVPDQPITEGPPPRWWPDGTGRPRVEEPPKPPSRPASGAVYVLSQIGQAAHRLLERRPQSRVFVTAVHSLKDVDDRVGVNGEVALVPLVDVRFVEDRPSQWSFDGEIAFLPGDLHDGPSRVGAEALETRQGRDRFADIILGSMDPWLRSVLGYFSVGSGVQRGDNLIAHVSLSVVDKQEEAFGELVLALQQANTRVSLEMTRAAIAAAREALARAQEAAETPRQKKLAKRALGYEEHWKRLEESLARIDALDRGEFLPVR